MVGIITLVSTNLTRSITLFMSHQVIPRLAVLRPTDRPTDRELPRSPKETIALKITMNLAK